jgi:hypothetical protein
MSLDIYLVCPCCKQTAFEHNITHNLAKMADEAGIYEVTWRANERECKAGELVERLEAGLQRLKNDPVKFRAFDAPNGWGLYEHLVTFVEQLLGACRDYPECSVECSR